jgi:hypothetical protein
MLHRRKLLSAERVRHQEKSREAGMGLIACHPRAAEWRHKEIELAAHELLQLLDHTSGG